MSHPNRSSFIAFIVLCLVWLPSAYGQMDETYATKIKEYTTDPRFLTDLVDHLPASSTVPSPLEHFGQIVGAPGVLHHTDEIYGYFRALDQASPRVSVRTIGKTEEGRDMIEVVVADEATISNLDSYRQDLNRLADPRTVSDADAGSILSHAKPIYYATAGLHSPETGSPEMLMELAYRLAVEDSPMIQEIRQNVIFMFVPVTEPDGRDRMVDIYNYRKAHRDVGPSLVYWGHYVAHDNNRDGFGLGLALTRNVLSSFLYWKPTIMHDLHESVPYLYVSTGTGPYNDYIDAITIDEWHNLAHEEVTQLTRRGMPGVWTHGFYTGWAANYLMWIANNRNAIGRFYETFGNSIADTKERKLSKRNTSREWYRPNPPLEKISWSLRNNTNYMESGLLVALRYVAQNRREFVENFYTKTKKAIQLGKDEAPYAWVIPRQQSRPSATGELVNLLMQQGIEIQVAAEDLRWSAGGKGKESKPTDGRADKEDKAELQSAAKGSYVVRMDQPYRTLVRILLDKQEFPKDKEPPYDDTGWTLPYLWQVSAYRVDDVGILSAKMAPLSEPVRVEGGLQGGGKPVYLVSNSTDDNVTVLRFRLSDVHMLAAEQDFEVGKRAYPAGSLIIRSDGNPAGLSDRLSRTATELGIVVQGVSKLPEISTHEVEVPRIALVHTWVVTPQDCGWWRLAFDRIGVPYTYLSEQDLATEDLSQYDVVIMPRSWASPQRLVAGSSLVGDPVPWKKSSEYRNIGVIDSTDDVRKGMGFEGVRNLKEFVRRGGVFITEGSSAAFPIDMTITQRVSIKRTRELMARGTVLRATVEDKKSPIVYGYDDSLAVYFSQSPVLQINKNVGNFATPDWYKDEVWEKEVPRVVLSFAKKDLLMSGMLRGEKEIAGAPAVVDVPVGDGHVVLFVNRPFWRWETHGSHALVFNTLLNWNDLRVGWPQRPSEEEEEESAAPSPGYQQDE